MAGTTLADTVSGNNISTVSYNTTGWNNFKVDFINTILLTFAVQLFAVQEHFLLKENLYKLDCFRDYEVFSIPAFKNNDSVHSGRPSGGLSLIYSHSVSQYVTRLTCPKSYRVHGLKINFPGADFLIINTYFPNDPRTNNFDDSELLNTLQDIKYLIDQVDESYNTVLMGDLNCDFSRDTVFVQQVKNFLIENNLRHVWEKFDCDFTFYHERFTAGRTIVSKSTIDHFCVKNEALNSCVEAMPLHFAENLSCHDPIFMKLDCVSLPPKHKPESDTSPKIPKPQWHKATSDHKNNYSQTLKDLIDNVQIDSNMLFCRDGHCSSQTHIDSLDQLCEDVMGCISVAVEENIPHSNSTGYTPVPGWSQYVQPYKERSVFWSAVWKSAGRPLDTELHRVMKYSRNQYHYAVRRVKNHESQLRKSKFIDACLNNEVSDILKDIRKSRSTNSSHSRVIDGHNTKSGIADHFQHLYSDIYNIHNDKDEVQKFINENNAKIDQSDIDLVESISPDLLKKIIVKLSDNKNDSCWDWKSDALKLGVNSLAEPLCDLLCAMLIHGHIPKIFLLCNLIPIVKNNNESKLSSNNYRLIAISSLLLKLFDHVILELSHQNLIPSPQQFGFQSGVSTTMCTWSLTETINFFRNRGGPVFLCLMDLTKAFDHVKFSLLFKKLSGKVAPILMRLLIFSYLNQECQVLWNGILSTRFKVSNGVRQGAVLSPCLFNLYINELFTELSSSGYGCSIDDLYFGCWGYADDLGLLAPSREALQMMINTCSVFFKDHGISISTNQDVNKTKTKVLTFGVEGVTSPVMLGTKPLPTVLQWPHLGVMISTSDESFESDLDDKRKILIGKISSLQQELGDQDPAVFVKLVQIYFLHLYGSSLWDIYSENSTKLWTAWHKFVKITFDLPFATHTYLLNDIIQCDHIKLMVIKRFLKFQRRLAMSSNPYIKVLLRHQTNDWRSSYGRNIMNICRDAQAADINSIDINMIQVNPVPVGEEWRIPLLKDLLDYQDTFLSETEVKLVLNSVCCD